MPFTATVISNYGSTILVETKSGDRIHCNSKKKLGQIVSGDRITWEQISPNQGVVIDVLPRKTLLSRPQAKGDPRPICANIDQIIVVISLTELQDGISSNNKPNTFLLDCYLVAAEINNVNPVIVLNKSDLIEDISISAVKDGMNQYIDLGYPLQITSAVTRYGLSDLKRILDNSTSVFVGESGVGKSSLIKLLLTSQDIQTSNISSRNKKGKHTTTASTLYHLPGGGNIIDSPGVREFRLWNVNAGNIAHGFREFREFLGKCRYRNCSHIEDDGCAIHHAVKKNIINPLRYASYRKIIASHKM